jgi:hypothetical protein
MRLRSALFALWASCALAPPAASQPAAPAAPHVRSISPRLAVSVSTLRDHSPTFAALLTKLDASDVIVHLVDGLEPCASGSKACLTFVESSGGYRYLRVMITKRESEADVRRHLAHELQHAVEIAQAPQIRDAAGLRAFCLSSGFGWRSADHCETRAAQTVAYRVEQELDQRMR